MILDQKWSIKRTKLLIKRLKNTKCFDFFDHFQFISISFWFILSSFWSILISFWSILISFWSRFDQFWSFIDNLKKFNRFCHNQLKSGFKFGLKKLIKRRYDHNIRRFVNLDLLDCLSLHESLPKHNFTKRVFSLWASWPRPSCIVIGVSIF